MENIMRGKTLSNQTLPTISSYSFGQMVIDSKAYSNDLIILPNGKITSPWWRQDGHCLIPADIDTLVKTQPEVIIAGTGASGLMQITKALHDYLAQRSIELIAQPTSKAFATYNTMAQYGKTGACFHLTC